MTLDQEAPHARGHMVVNRAISRRTGPIVEIARPADQHAVDVLANCLPRVFVAPAQDCADPRLEPSDTLLRWAGPEIPLAILREIVGSEAVAEEVETLLACIAQTGLKTPFCWTTCLVGCSLRNHV